MCSEQHVQAFATMLNWTTQRGLIATHCVSGISVWLDIFLIFSVPAFHWHAQPGDIAFIAACLGLPSLLFGPVAGALVDRVDVRRSIVFAAFARGGLSLALAFAPNILLFGVFVLAKGFANLLYFPSSSVINNRLIPSADRLPYYGTLSMVDQISKVSIPLVAGFLATAFPSRLLFLLSAASAISAGLMVLRVVKHVPASPGNQKASLQVIYRDVINGFHAMKTLHPDLKVGILLSAGASLTLALYDPHLAAYLAHRGFDAKVFAWIMASTAAGAIACAAWVRWKLKDADPVQLRKWGITTFVVSVGIAAFVMSTADQGLLPYLSLLVWFLNGFGYEMFVMSNNVVTQNLAPRDMIGRITTSMRSLQMTCVIGGPVIGAAIIEHTSREAPFLFAALLGGALAAFACWRKSARLQQSEAA